MNYLNRRKQNIRDLPLFLSGEADQASVNTNEETELESSEDDDHDKYDNPTAINAKIRLILINLTNILT